MLNKLVEIVLFHVIGSTSLLLQTNYKNLFVRKKYNFFHEYHILDPSPWPFCLSLSIFLVTVGLVIFFHFNYSFFLIFGFFQVIFVSYVWLDNVVYESLDHTVKIRNGLRMGMILFIVSEIMFFFSFFWAFFYLSLSPAVELGCSWPPVGMQNILITPLRVPFLNTLILLCSGVVVTCAHHGLDFSVFEFKKKLYNVCLFLFFIKLNFNSGKIIQNYTIKTLSYLFFSFRFFFLNKKRVLIYLLFTIILAFSFTFLQILEYCESAFYMSDGAYGSTFFMMTGFHGFHVLIGTILLLVCLIRLFFGHFDDTNYVGFESAIWYWHFVDVVWLFLFIFIYIWGFLPRIGGFVITDENFINVLTMQKFMFFDYAKEFQINFQDPATKIASDLINLHHNVVFFLILNLLIVVFLLICIYTTSSSSNQILLTTNADKVSNLNQFKVFFNLNSSEFILDQNQVYFE